jgi:hypothetical protein
MLIGRNKAAPSSLTPVPRKRNNKPIEIKPTQITKRP